MPSTACDQCYRRKTGCAGEKPVCNRCTVAGLTCTYSTGRPVGKPKGHRKAKSCGASISQSAGPHQGSPPVPSLEAGLGRAIEHIPTISNTRSHREIIDSPAEVVSVTSAELYHSSSMPSAAPCGNLLCDASPGYTSQSNHSTTSPYEPSGPQAGSGDEGYFTPTALPQSSWSESAGTSAWPIQSFAIDFMNGPTSIVADMPAFGADANVDHRWVQQISTAANTPSMLMQSNGISLPCQCSMLLDDITALFRCQVSLPRTNFDQVLQVIHTAIQKGQTSLDCYGCATHGLQAVLTNVVVMLQQAAVCLQAILAIIDHDPCLATAGIKAEGYNLDTAELKMRMLHTMIDHELDGMQQLAHTVSTMAHMEHTHGKAYSGIMPLLTALQESLDVLRGRSMQPAQT